MEILQCCDKFLPTLLLWHPFLAGLGEQKARLWKKKKIGGKNIYEICVEFRAVKLNVTVMH